MKTTAYRLIDKLAGGLMCWILSIPKMFRHSNYTSERELYPKRILIIKLWAIGDSVVSLPLIKSLKKRYPESQIDLIARKRVIPIFEGIKEINSIIQFNLFKTIFLLRKYDLAIDLEPYLNLSALISFYTAKERFGFSKQTRSKIYTKTTDFRKDQHMVENYLDFLKLLNKEINAEDKKLAGISYNYYDKSTADNFLKANSVGERDILIGICAGAGESAKTRMWDKNNFAKLADNLIMKYKAKVMFIGGESEEELCEEIIESAQNKKEIINAVNKFSLKESCALIEKCRLFVSNDTGPMHIAAAQGVKTIGLFGPNTPVLWKPYGEQNIAVYKNVECSPCILNDKGIFPECLRKSDKYLCMRLITISDVMLAVEKIIHR